MWISIHEKIPDIETDNTSVDCLFKTANSEVFTGYLYINNLSSDGCFRAFSLDDRTNKDITHWKLGNERY